MGFPVFRRAANCVSSLLDEKDVDARPVLRGAFPGRIVSWLLPPAWVQPETMRGLVDGIGRGKKPNNHFPITRITYERCAINTMTQRPRQTCQLLVNTE